MTTTRDPTGLRTLMIPAPRDEPTRETIDRRVLDQLADTLVHDLFGIGLRLQTVLPSLSADAAQQLNAVIDETDRMIRHIRDVIFAPEVPCETPAGPCDPSEQ